MYINRLKEIWAAVYDPQKDTKAVIESGFHPDYTQCINGVIMTRPAYIEHVIAQKNTMTVDSIRYVHFLEKDDQLFAIYYPQGKNLQGAPIEAEVICYVEFRENQILKIHGQVRLIEGALEDVDMKNHS